MERSDRDNSCVGLAPFELAVAADLHNVRFLGFFTILATILAVFLGRAIARRMRAFSFLGLCHRTSLLSAYLCLTIDPKTQNCPGQERN
jgi:hypothetical protein